MMNPLKGSLLLMFVGVLLAFTSCSLLGGGSGDDGPRLTDLPGKIVYSSDRGVETHLFVTDQKGTKQLTSGEGMEAGDYHAADPSFSPDGEWVVYVSNQGAPFGAEAIYRVRVDGSGNTPLTDSDGNLILGRNPVFSPDGKQVAFNRPEMFEPGTFNHDVYVLELASGQVRRLTEVTADDESPAWSPDGSRIAFASNRDYTEADSMRWRQDLYVIDVDGRNLTRLTETGNATRPVWSPNGDKIAYEWNRRGNNVFLYEISTGKITDVDSGLQFSGNPMWNRNGTQLLVSGREAEGAQPEIRLLNIEDEPSEVLQKITLDTNSVGRDYDWYNGQQN